MLEGLVATLLNRFLGMYIQNFDPKQLNIGIWSGDVQLRNLELRKEALDQMKLPLNVVEGHLGKLTLTIPWSNLKGKPVKVLIEDIFLLAAPKADQEYDEEEEERRRQRIKQEKLNSVELINERTAAGMSEEEQKKNQSFTDSLVTKIIDNLQVTVKNIHIRYEDAISTPGHPFALGFTLEEFSAVSTDKNWEPSFIADSIATTHKLAKLGSLAIYWNTDAKLLGGKTSHQEVIAAFQDMIATGKNTLPGHQFVLKPVSGIGRVEMSKGGSETPRMKARLLFDEIGFILDEDQYRDALMMVDLFHFYIRHQQYKKFQPKGLRPKQDPKAWFRYAGNAILSQIHEKNRRWSWAYFEERSNDRKRYIELFKKKKKENITPPETEALDKLEWKLTYEDLRFYRSLARNQLKKERALVKKTEDKPKPQPQGWGSWIWGSTAQKKEEVEVEAVMTEEQRKEFYEAIDWDEKKAIAEAVDLPRDTIKMQIETSLKTGSFTLRRDPHGRQIEILSLLFDTFKAKVLQRPDSFYGELSLGGLRVYDGTTPGTLFPQIVRIKKSEHPAAEGQRIEELGKDDQQVSEIRTESDLEEPFFEATFEQNPLDQSADSSVTAKMRSMEIIYNPRFLEEIARFFKPPERHMESIGALLETAGATVEGIRQQTRAGLEFALEEHKTLNAKLDLQAPLIIIPESCTKKGSNCLVLDAGHISVSSDLVSKELIEEVQAKQTRKYNEEDYEQLESLMYDKFKLTLHSTQVLIGPSIDETISQLSNESGSKHFYIVDRINIDFLVQISILPKAPNLTKFKISGHLPVLQASISDAKYKALMRIIDVAIPKFDDASGTQKKPAIKTAPDTKPETYNDITQQSAFQFSSQQHEIIIAEEGSEKSDEDKFEEASDGYPDDSPSIQQRTFEFKFTVDKLQGSLFRADSDGSKPEKELVTIVAEHFSLNFYIRPFDMAAEVVLQTFNIEDLIDENPSPDFRKIVTSDAFNTEPGKPLFLVKYVKVNPLSPEFMTIYEAIETNVDVSISTINVVITRKTILTLLDFILTTFTNPENPAPQGSTTGSENPNEADTTDDQISTPGAQADNKIRVKIDLKSIILILNHDGIRLATLSLNSADVGIFLRGKTIRLGARLGNFTLLDDINQGAEEDSPFRQLVSIQGDELADFRYETFDPDSPMSYPGYNSSIYLRSGSIKVNFVEEPFRKIIDFAVKFGQMQALFNAARLAAMNQANQIQNPDKIHFDILVKTPIIVFPRVAAVEDLARDLMTAYLGELYAQNKFVPLDDSKGAAIVNKISTGIRKTKVASEFHFEDGQKEELELLDQLDLAFDISYLEHRDDIKRPDLEIDSEMSDINLKLTQSQYKFLLELSQSIPAVFAGEPASEDDLIHDLPIPDQSVREALDLDNEMEKKGGPDTIVNLYPELTVGPGTWTTLDLVFKVGRIGMELFECESDRPVGNLQAASLSRAYLDNTHIKLRMINDGSLESELLIDSFNIKDSRKLGTNKFRNIMSSSNHEGSQFMANIRMSGGKKRNLIAIATIDSPRIVFALDYIFALKDFVMEGFARDDQSMNVELLNEEDEEDDSSTSAQSQESHQSRSLISSAKPPKKAESKMDISFRVNVVDSQVILIANPSSSNSEAIVLGTKQILIAQQQSLTLQISEVGMFLCRMDKFDENRLRVLDDFTLKVAMDNKNVGPLHTMTNIMVEVEPLVLRVSLRDILLVTQIINKASEMSQPKAKKVEATTASTTRLKPSGSTVPKSQRPPTERVSSAVKRKAKSLTTAKSFNSREQGKQHNAPTATIRQEELKAEVEGMRVILIGDQHELPLLDVSVKHFTAKLRDWTGDMTADTSIETFINIYNFSKSAWEPLIEPWQLGFHMRRTQNPDKLSIEFYSRKMLELTITSQTIALASKAAQFMQQDEDILTKPRGADAPYRIRNQTGYPLHVWAVTDSLIDGEQMAVKLDDGQEAPWRFEEWEKMRENLSPDGTSGLVGIKLEDTPFDSIKEIPVNREGETVYSLRPARDNILYRLLCEVHLGSDNVKYVTFRSPLLVVNNTQIPIELAILDLEHRNIIRMYTVPPGEGQPLPIELAYSSNFVVRPNPGFGFDWSNEKLHWKEIVRRSTGSFSCRSTDPESPNPFFFHMNATIPNASLIGKSYPHMKISLSAPLVVENLLPYDFKFRIYDKHSKKEWTNFLRKGGVSPVHVVELSHLLLLSIEMQDTVFKRSAFAIINTNNTEFDREDTLACQDMQGLTLNLMLHYFPIPDSGGAFKVSVYSPYIIQNKTGMDIFVKSKSFLQYAKAAAGQLQSTGGPRQKPTPYMFSFTNDDRQNRAVLRVGDSNWSRPLSFDAIGSASEIVLTSASKANEEIHVGLYVEEGHGKYKMTRIVTLTPRFILKSKLSEEIHVRELGSPNVMELKPGELLPLYFMKNVQQKQLCFSFAGVNSTWTSPFNIQDLGSVHLKISKAGQRQKLLRIEVLAEQSTIFLHVSMETKNWPFSIRNESQCEFTFFQATPYDDDDINSSRAWKPIRYRLPPRSVMPYAWDYPAAKLKELVLTANGKERHVKLAEIGDLIPLKLQTSDGDVATINISVYADGPTNTLALSEYKASKSMYKPKANSSSTSVATREGFEIVDNDSGVTFRTQLRFAGIGISLINTKLKELAYITFRDLEFTYSESSLYQTINLICKWIQIDNQLYGGIFPIILYPSVVQKTGQEMDVHPSLHASVMRVKNNAYGVHYIKYATILLQQMTIEIDEDFLYALLDFTKIPGASWGEQSEGTLGDETLDIPEPKQTDPGTDFYFELLNIQPAQLDLSFVRTDRVNVEDKTSSHNPFMFVVNVLTMAIGNINDAPIRLNALMLENARVSLPLLAQHVQTHYTQQAIYQVHNILGSADFLGNPVGLFNNISSGVMDIFYEPYKGLIMTDRPQELGIGIAKGATSFVRKSVFGVSDSLSKVTGSMAKGLTAATLDKQFQDQRRMTRARNRPKHALYGVTQGAQSFATSIASGFDGLARKPIEGAEREGALGFFKGIGKGVVGLATKPAIGIFDLASNVTEGIRNTTTVFDTDGLDRVRLTRFIGQDGIVRPYSQREALGQFWLKQLDNGKYFSEEYIAHLELTEHDSVVMLTYKRIMMIKSKKLYAEWDISLKELQTISMEKTGIALYLRGNRQGPFIPVVDESQRQFLFKKIGLAVNSFNSTATTS